MSRQIALQLEWKIRKLLSNDGKMVDRGVMIVSDADYILNGGAFSSVAVALSPYYYHGSIATKEKIESFLENNYYELYDGEEEKYYQYLEELVKNLKIFAESVKL